MSLLSPEEIRSLRQALGLTLKELGNLVGVTERCVGHWENGRAHPTYKKMVRLNELRDQKKRQQQPA